MGESAEDLATNIRNPLLFERVPLCRLHELGDGPRPAELHHEPQLIVFASGVLLYERPVVRGDVPVVRVFLQHVDLEFYLLLFVLVYVHDFYRGQLSGLRVPPLVDLSIGAVADDFDQVEYSGRVAQTSEVDVVQAYVDAGRRHLACSEATVTGDLQLLLSCVWNNQNS